MVQFLQRPRSFGEQIGEQLGSGLSQGIDFATQLGLEKYKGQQRQKLISDIERDSQQQSQPLFSQEEMQSKFLEILPQLEQQIGRELAPEDLNQIWSMMQQQQQQPMHSQEPDDFIKAKKYAAAGEHDLSRIAGEEAKTTRKERFSREQALEPKLLELQDQLSKSEETGLRFDRLKELTSPEFQDKFPPSLMTALFTKGGELIPTAQAALSPEAQEFTKLVVDEIQGAQKTYGGKVSNFEAAQYLKKLPSLLNTPEGRNGVLRDLRIMNKLTQMHDQGVLDIMERYNNNISLSKANTIYRKENAKQEANMKKAFIHPNEFPFTELNDFNASIYSGVTIQDPETDQTFTSDGRSWIPE